jgi:hypothetical protein
MTAMQIQPEPNDGLICNLYHVDSVAPVFKPVLGTTGLLRAKAVTVAVSRLSVLEEMELRSVAAWAAAKFGVDRDKVTIADRSGEWCSFPEWPAERPPGA